MFLIILQYHKDQKRSLKGLLKYSSLEFPGGLVVKDLVLSLRWLRFDPTWELMYVAGKAE